MTTSNVDRAPNWSRWSARVLGSLVAGMQRGVPLFAAGVLFLMSWQQKRFRPGVRFG